MLTLVGLQQDASTDHDNNIANNVNRLLQDPSYTPEWGLPSASQAPEVSTSAYVHYMFQDMKDFI